MPYVEVWVDEEPCDGECESAKEAEELQAKLDEVERLLRAGEPIAALHVITEDPALMVKSPREIAMRYEDLKDGLLEGFELYRGRQ